MVDGVLLAIGGQEDIDWASKKKTSAIHAFHHVDQKWQHVGDLPFECSRVNTILLSGRSLLLVVDMESTQMMMGAVEG